MIEIILAGDPVGKGRPRFSRKSGTVYTPKKTASYENRLAWAAQQAMAGGALLEGPLTVAVSAFIGVPLSASMKRRAKILNEQQPTKKPDADNVAKLLDSLNKVVWVDDAQIVDLFVCKRYSDRPRLEIRVSKFHNSEIEPLTSFF